MAIVNIIEGFTGIDAGGSDDDRTATRVFTVLTDDPTHRGLFAWPLTAGGVTIPAPGDEHPDDPTYLSKVPQVSRKAGGFFEVKVPYSTKTDPNSQYTDPLSIPADISWEDNEYSLPYDRDLDGKATVNFFNEPFDPPLTREVFDPVLIIERNQAGFSPQTKLDLQGTVCSEVFWGAAIGRALLKKLNGRKVNEGHTYWRARYEIHFRFATPEDTPAAKAWFNCQLHRGCRYLDAGGVIRPTPNGEIVNLKEDGTLATLASQAFWLYFREHASASWAALGINNT